MAAHKPRKTRAEQAEEEHRKHRSLRARAQKGRKRLSDKAKAQMEEALGNPDDGDYQDMGFDLPRLSNRLWEVAEERRRRDKYKKRLVDGPEDIFVAANEYFKWAESNPLYEAKIFSTQKGLKKSALPKLRAFTIEGLCIFLGISRDTWMMWGRKDVHPDLADAVCEINSIIKEQKFSGAAVDLLNSSLIARDLGLADKSEISGPEGGPMEFSAKEILADRLSRLAAAQQADPKTPASKKPGK